jgi:hypothetical protein
MHRNHRLATPSPAARSSGCALTSRQMRWCLAAGRENVQAHTARVPCARQCGPRHSLGRQRASPPPVVAGPRRAASSATGHGIVRGGGHPSRSAHNAGSHPRLGCRCKSRSHTANRSYAAGPCGVCTACRPPYRSWPATVPTEPSAARLGVPNAGRRASARRADTSLRSI